MVAKRARMAPKSSELSVFSHWYACIARAPSFRAQFASSIPIFHTY